MRRKDREITDRRTMLEIMARCDVCRLALNDPEGWPYILPLNFGVREEDGRVALYFHGAAAGKKYELIARDARAAFEMDCGHELVLDETDGNCTMIYESVIGRGRIEIVPDEEKYDALCVLMGHYRAGDFPYNKAVIPQTTVLRLVVEQMTAKARRRPRH